jgi:hypothetical protein
MKKTKIALLATALLVTPFAQAAWESVNNFDSGSTAGITLTRTFPEETTNGGITIIADPTDATKGILEMDPGVFGGDGTQTFNIWISIPFPDIAAVGTVYNRIQFGELVDVVWGTSPVAEPASYGDFSSALRMELDGIFDYREGADGYPEIAGGAREDDTWYETWFVLDSTTQTYDAYIKGGDWAEQTQIVTGAAFRKQGTDPQNRFYMRMSTGDIANPKSVDKVLIDDLTVDTTGENLTTPGDDVVVTDPGEVPTENGSGELSNLSTRGSVSTGENAMFVGFVATQDSRRFLIRGAGPLLGGFGVNGFLANPVITVRNAADQSVVATNEDWGDNSNAASIALTAASVGAQPFADGSADAALMLFLAPGVYTVEVSSGDGTTGVALAEIYRIP